MSTMAEIVIDRATLEKLRDMPNEEKLNVCAALFARLVFQMADDLGIHHAILHRLAECMVKSYQDSRLATLDPYDGELPRVSVDDAMVRAAVKETTGEEFRI